MGDVDAQLRQRCVSSTPYAAKVSASALKPVCRIRNFRFQNMNHLWSSSRHFGVPLIKLASRRHVHACGCVSNRPSCEGLSSSAQDWPRA